LHGATGWRIDMDRGVLGGARLDDGAWVPWSPPCSQAGGPAVLAASDTIHLVAVCDEGLFASSTQVVRMYVSGDAGASFYPVSAAPPDFPPDSIGLASPTPSVVIMGGNDGNLEGTFDGGATWSVVNHQPGSLTWLQVGFTTPSQGVAIDGKGTLLMTFNGGHGWAPVHF